MSARCALGVPALAVCAGAWAANDKAGCKDHPLFPTRMPGYFIAD